MKKIEKIGDSSEIAMFFADRAAYNKAEDVVVIDVRNQADFTDFFVVCHARSTRHVAGITEELEQEAAKLGIRPRNIEGMQETRWVLMDFGDVIVNIFYEPLRSFYDLEGLWNKSPKMSIASYAGRETSDED
ncbi:MAG: ribosome silencing factor [Dissulfuribacterales bacterium]